jgi:hypothetical protein
VTQDLIPLEDTPIFTQLLAETRAKEAYTRFFEENDEPDA